MKICSSCGAHCSDDRMFCIDCNEKLGDKLSVSAEEEIHSDLKQKIERMYNKKDPLYVSKFDKVMGVLSLAGAATSLIFIIIRLFAGQNIGLLLLYATLFFLLSSVEALIPRITWELEKFRLSFSINGADDVEPGDFYLIGRKIAIISMAVLGVAALVMSIFYVFK